MPTSLLGRTLLIMLVPLVVVQVIALQTILWQPPRHRVSPAVQRDRRRDRLHGRVVAPVPRSDREWVLQTAREQFDAGHHA